MSKLRLFQHSRQVHHKRKKDVLPQKMSFHFHGGSRVFPQKCVVQAPLLSDSRGNSGVAEDRTSFFFVVGFINFVRYILAEVWTVHTYRHWICTFNIHEDNVHVESHLEHISWLNFRCEALKIRTVRPVVLAGGCCWCASLGSCGGARRGDTSNLRVESCIKVGKTRLRWCKDCIDLYLFFCCTISTPKIVLVFLFPARILQHYQKQHQMEAYHITN